MDARAGLASYDAACETVRRAFGADGRARSIFESEQCVVLTVWGGGSLSLYFFLNDPISTPLVVSARPRSHRAAVKSVSRKTDGGLDRN